MNRALKGNLKDVSLTRILIELNRNRATGTLAVTTPPFHKEYLCQGRQRYLCIFHLRG